MSNPTPSLLAFLTASLSPSFVPAGHHSYQLRVLRSQPQRSHALFPHATNAKHAKVWHEEVLVVLSERRTVPRAAPPAAAVGAAHAGEGETKGQAGAGSLNEGGTAKTVEEKVAENKEASSASVSKVGNEGAQSTSATAAEPSTGAQTGPVEEEEHFIPLVALEATIYTIPSSSSSLLYISKVDTTGLSASASPSAPTRPLVSAFIAFHLLHPPHGMHRVRVHIFARAQGQYLFPGSVDNKGKRVLDDKGLLRWWKGTAERAVKAVEAARPASGHGGAQEDAGLRMFYLIPGLSFAESLPYVPASPSPPQTAWSYSHPYSTLSSPLHSPSAPSAHPLTDHLPAFPDDPKSRFLHSLTSSTVSASGTTGDWDDAFLALASATFTTGQAPGAKRAALEADLERERKRLVEGVPGGVDEWWERMAFRQECCSGQLVGFFVLAGGEPPASSYAPAPAAAAAPASLALPTPPSPAKSDSGRSTSSSSHSHSSRPRPLPLPLAVPATRFTKLWSAFHNQDYSLPALPLLAANLAKWAGDVERMCKLSGEEERGEGKEVNGEEWRKLWEDEGVREVSVTGEAQTGEKRKAEDEPKKVNMLAPRKKKKPAA
ncbi:hypothetical protein JCM10213_001079 [Rhodosporidiobolus nylandii]